MLGLTMSDRTVLEDLSFIGSQFDKTQSDNATEQDLEGSRILDDLQSSNLSLTAQNHTQISSTKPSLSTDSHRIHRTDASIRKLTTLFAAGTEWSDNATNVGRLTRHKSSSKTEDDSSSSKDSLIVHPGS